MDWLILVLLVAAFFVSLLAHFLLRSAPSPTLDGDHYDVDEMLAAFGIGEDWV